MKITKKQHEEQNEKLKKIEQARYEKLWKDVENACKKRNFFDLKIAVLNYDNTNVCKF